MNTTLIQGLEIVFRARVRVVKEYNLIPDMAVVRALGADKEHRHQLADVVKVLRLPAKDVVYMLFRQMTLSYIGITQNIRRRLDEHFVKRTNELDWDRALVFCVNSLDMNTNIASYIEHTLFLHMRSKGFNLLQSPPSSSSVNKRGEALAERAINEMKLILELLDLARPVVSIKTQEMQPEQETSLQEQEVAQDVAALTTLVNTNSEEIEVSLRTRGANARGRYTAFGLEVFAGSIGTAELQDHMKKKDRFLKMRAELLKNKIVAINDSTLMFRESYTFSSATAAAQILCGSNAPGPLVWKRTTDGKPLVEIRSGKPPRVGA